MTVMMRYAVRGDRGKRIVVPELIPQLRENVRDSDVCIAERHSTESLRRYPKVLKERINCFVRKFRRGGVLAAIDPLLRERAREFAVCNDSSPSIVTDVDAEHDPSTRHG